MCPKSISLLFFARFQVVFTSLAFKLKKKRKVQPSKIAYFMRHQSQKIGIPRLATDLRRTSPFINLWRAPNWVRGHFPLRGCWWAHHTPITGSQPGGAWTWPTNLRPTGVTGTVAGGNSWHWAAKHYRPITGNLIWGCSGMRCGTQVKSNKLCYEIFEVGGETITNHLVAACGELGRVQGRRGYQSSVTIVCWSGI